MNLLDLLQRTQPPVPWQEGDNIPWHDVDFSARMLAEHLTQAHDHASRRSHLIDQHVAWIHQLLLQEKPAHLLDLGCGPGFYTNRLAQLGHTCVGIDYSPASIAYAQKAAKDATLSCVYHHADMRSAEYGSGYGFIMLLFGEFNVFRPSHIASILAKAYQSLEPGGLLLLEPHTRESLLPGDKASNTWFSSTGGLFSPSPHLVLLEEHWDQSATVKTIRYFIIDVATAKVTRYAQSMQAYSVDQYQKSLANAGFTEIKLLPGLAHDRITPDSEFHAIIARKPV